jgi:hypothetical protein
MKNTAISYINDQHKEIVQTHIQKIKKVMYFATEDAGDGKYKDFLDILDSIYLYSNNFYDTMVSKRTRSEILEEFIFLIPNMVFYTAIGFLTALKDGENDFLMRDSLETIGSYCEGTTSELADIIIDEKETKKILQDILENKISKN